jgi:type II secretory pathway component PulM
MTDKRRSLLTDREREILLNNGADVSEGYYGVVVSRARSRIQRLESDIQALKEHPTLYDELLEVIPDRERPAGRVRTDNTDTDPDSSSFIEDGLDPDGVNERVVSND